MIWNRTLLATLCTAALALAQEKEPVQKPPPQQVSEQDTKKLAAAMQQQFAAEKIVVDAKAQTVVIPAVMNQPPDPIEYLLIHKKGKRHEAVFITGCKPSVLNAALLLLGLPPGKNASTKEKSPPPSIEEIEKGADPVIITPPEGTEMFITVRWKDADGKPVERCVEDLIVDLQGQQLLQRGAWIFLGGRMAQLYKNDPEVFVADVEGNLISVCYLAPDNHLATLRHDRARDDQNWWISKHCPEPGTEVEMVFWRQRPKLFDEREARLKEEAAKEAAEKKDKPAEGKTQEQAGAKQETGPGAGRNAGGG
jgi:hypothetical protein